MLKKITLFFGFLSLVLLTGHTTFGQVHIEYGESLNIKDYNVAHTNTFMPYGAIGVYQDIKDITFNNDGTAMFYVFDNAIIDPPNANSIYNALVQKYTLSTPYDFSTRSYDSEKDLSTDTGVDNPENIKFNNIGDKMYILDDNLLRMYTLSAPYNITTASLSYTVGLDYYIEILTGFTFSKDGSELYITGRKNSAVPITRGIYQFSLETPFDISSEKTYQGLLNISAIDQNPQDVEISADGKKIIIIGQQTNKFIQYTLNTPFDITTAVFSKIIDFSAQQTNANGFAANNDGSKLYLLTHDPINRMDTYDIDNKTLTEGIENDGNFPFSEKVRISLIGDTFSENNANSLDLTVTGIPDGLSYTLTMGPTQTYFDFRLYGASSRAVHHRSIDNISTIVFNFSDSAFTNSTAAEVATNSTDYNNNISLAYRDPILSILSYSPSLYLESASLDSNVNVIYETNINSQVINSRSFVASGSQTGSVSGSFQNNGSGTYFIPDANFKPGEAVTVTISNQIVLNPKSYIFRAEVPVPGFPATISDPKIIVSNTAGDATSVVTGDINSDGHLDIIAASFSADKVSWYENDGLETPDFIEHNISNTIDGAWNVNVADINKDGHLDILVVSVGDDTVAWYENDGNASPNFTQHILSSTFDNPRSITSGDMNNDGYIDILAASYNQDEIVWYENNGLETPSFIEHSITVTANGVRSIEVCDINRDGYLDVISASLLDNTIAWYKNDGATMPSFTKTIIDNNAIGAQSVKVGDLNNDGYPDVIAASSGDNTISWYRNYGDANQTSGKQPITFNAQSARSVSIGDVDGDGILDILSASSLDNTIAWYKSDNEINPQYTQHIVNTTANSAFSVAVGDLDGNGTLDIVSASQSDNTVAWYPTMTSTLNLDTNIPTKDIIIFPNPASNTFTIQNTNNASLTKLTIYDLSGRLVKTIDLKNALETTIDISDLNSAAYFLKIISSQGIRIKKLIKH